MHAGHLEEHPPRGQLGFLLYTTFPGLTFFQVALLLQFLRIKKKQEKIESRLRVQVFRWVPGARKSPGPRSATPECFD